MANANWEHAHLYMDDAGTVIASSDLSSQVVDLTAGGGSLPDPTGEPDGDVLTVSSGSAVWSPGGGSQPTYESRSLYSGDSVVVTDSLGANTFLTWDSLGSGAALLDIVSDPTQPTVIAGGIYAVTASVICDEYLTDGGAFQVVAHLDMGNEDAVGEGTGGSGIQKAGGDIQAIVCVAQTYYIPPGGIIAVSVMLDDGAANRSFRLREASIQLLPGGPA